MSADVHSGWRNEPRPKIRGNARANLAAADAIPSPDPPEGDPLAALGAIQQRVARLIGLGLTNAEIGAVMGISEHSVKHHMTTVFRTLPIVGSSSRRLAFLIGFWAGRQGRGREGKER